MTYKSDILEAVHEAISDLQEIGLVDKKTKRRFDESCLTPVEELTPEQIKAIREETHASQTVFARHLNVSPSVVSQWERGARFLAARQARCPIIRAMAALPGRKLSREIFATV